MAEVVGGGQLPLAGLLIGRTLDRMRVTSSGSLNRSIPRLLLMAIYSLCGYISAWTVVQVFVTPNGSAPTERLKAAAEAKLVGRWGSSLRMNR